MSKIAFLSPTPQARATVLVLLDTRLDRRQTAREVSQARNESADDYPGVIAQLNARCRVIESFCGIQWIVQRKHGAAGWRGVSFFRTKEALLRCAGYHPALAALPDRFPEAAE